MKRWMLLMGLAFVSGADAGENKIDDAFAAWQSGDETAAVVSLEQFANQTGLAGEQRAAALYLAGLLGMRSGDPIQVDASITSLGAAASADESRRDAALCLQADAKLLLNRAEEALAIYSAVIERQAKEPWRSRAGIGRGIALLVLGRNADSAQEMQLMADERNLPPPIRAEAAARATKALMLANSSEEAVTLVGKAINFAKGNPEAGRWVQEAALMLPRNKASLPLLEKAAALDGGQRKTLNEAAESIRLREFVWE